MAFDRSAVRSSRPGDRGPSCPAVRAGIAAGVLAAVAACVSTQAIDAIPDRPDARGYHTGMVLRLLQDRLIEAPAGTFDPGPDKLVARPHNIATASGSASVEDYRRDPRRWPGIRGIAPAGSLLRVQRIEKHGHALLESTYSVVAEITTGPCAGHLVELAWVSARRADDRRLWIEPTEFEVIADR